MKTIRMNQEGGFTLIEIMVSMVISSMVIAGIYGVYTIQQRSYTVTEQVAEMQQKIRSALDFMSREIRMANYNPKAPYDSDGSCDDVKIWTAETAAFSFEYCKVEKTGAHSYSSVKLKSSYSLDNVYGDDTIDFVVKHDSGNNLALAEGVDALEFQYLDVKGNALPTPVAVGKICSVQVSMLVRASYPDPRYINTIKYIPASGNPAWQINGGANPANDHYHRRLLITSIQLRNNI